jgi:hypothetical protein
MKNALTTIQISIRVAWTVVLILGLGFWAGLDPSLIKIHIVIGGVLVLSLWGLAFLAVRARVSIGLVVLVIAWSLVLPALGYYQDKILSLWAGHWVIHIVHLLVGLGALGQAEMLGGRIKTHLEASKASRRPTRRARAGGR